MSRSRAPDGIALQECHEKVALVGKDSADDAMRAHVQLASFEWRAVAWWTWRISEHQHEGVAPRLRPATRLTMRHPFMPEVTKVEMICFWAKT